MNRFIQMYMIMYVYTICDAYLEMSAIFPSVGGLDRAMDI